MKVKVTKRFHDTTVKDKKNDIREIGQILDVDNERADQIKAAGFGKIIPEIKVIEPKKKVIKRRRRK